MFICPDFMGYNYAIKKEIEFLGGQVTMFNDRPYNGVYDFFKKINVTWIKKYQNTIWKDRLSKIDLNSFNTLFVIRGEFVPDFVFDKCKKAGLEMIMYQWDSLKNYDYSSQKGYFTKVATFDREDSEKFGLHYFPLFFRKEYAQISQSILKSKAALFVGTFQFKRYSSVLELKERLNKIEISTTIKIKIPYYYYLKLRMKGIKLDKRYLIFKNISTQEIIDLYSKYDIIIDIANENQSGLTMRTFESLGANKILLTNNESIVLESFYDSNRIKLVTIPFLENTFNNEGKYNIVDSQRLDNWVLEILR